jgi:hypothetical protein
MLIVDDDEGRDAVSNGEPTKHLDRNSGVMRAKVADSKTTIPAASARSRQV